MHDCNFREDLRVSPVPTQPVLPPRSHSSKMMQCLATRPDPRGANPAPATQAPLAPGLGPLTAQENIKQKQTRLPASCPSQGSLGPQQGLVGPHARTLPPAGRAICSLAFGPLAAGGLLELLLLLQQDRKLGHACPLVAILGQCQREPGS